jgi:hypothetical protein
MPNAKLSIAAVLLLTACAPNELGVLAASKTGSLLETPAQREHPLAAVRASCGEPGPVSEKIDRHPYVQRVTSSSARVMWTSSDGFVETVRVWRDGEEPRERAGDVEDSRYLRQTRQLAAEFARLEPATVYCYELVDRSGARVFGPSGFTTAPEAADHVDLVVFGDSGSGGQDQATVAAQLETVPMDLMLHVGDLAYENGLMGELESNHFAMYRPLMASLPMFPAIGDHDDATDGAGPFREAFALPEMGAERYYSFDWGPVHVVVLDSVGSAPEQAAWAEQDLASSTAPWKIAVVSEPPYSSGFHGSQMDVRNTYAPIFARHGVSVVFSGDDHDYERSKPIDGVTYVVTGGGGRSVRPVGTSDFTAFSEKVLHFVYVSIDEDVMRLHAIDATGREFDGVEIPRAR